MTPPLETYATLTELIEGLSARERILFRYTTEFRTFSYSSHYIYKRILQWGEFLDALKIKKGDKLMLWGHNCPEWVIVFLGCVAKRVIVVPIDANAREELVTAVQREVNARLMVRSRYTQASRAIKTVVLEEVEHTIKHFSGRIDIQVSTPEEIVEIVYTSGTTSTPKGVVLTHKNITTNLNDLLAIIPLKKYVTLSVLPLSHLFEQTINLFLPLATQSTVVYLKTLKPSAILSVLKREQVNIVVLVPRLLEALKNAVARYDHWYTRWLVRQKLPHFWYFVCGGAPLNVELELFWKRMGFVVLQGYGLTETSPVISCNTPSAHAIGSVGRLLPSVEVNIIDGEIWAKGDSVFKEYYHDQKKTKESFSDGWFKTGDVGEWIREKYLCIKGRKKDMIVTSEGLNAYPEDIEAVLNKISGVKESCVVGLKQHHGEEVHAVVLLKNPQADCEEIARIANEKLAPHQQILGISIWPYPDFPRTTTLKVKKNAVREYLTKEKKPVGIVTQKNKLYAVLTEVTKAPPAQIKTTAILTKDLKLSSVDRVEVVSRLEEVFNIDIDEESITATTTVGDVEKLIAAQKHIRETLTYRRWMLWYPIQIVRYWVQALMLFPLTKLFCRTTVQGMEHLKEIKEQVIFISNHQSYLDAPVILMAMPWWIRDKVCPAAWAEYFTAKTLGMKILKRLAYEFTTLFFAVYPFAQTKSFKKNMENTGALLDNGRHILLFPEGTRTTTGKVLPFKKGIGMMASHMKVPIVPIKIEGLFRVLPRGAWWPRRGTVTITVEKPLQFGTESYVEITERLEKIYKV